MVKTQRKTRLSSWLWLVAALTIIGLAITFLLVVRQPSKDITDFQSCKNAGGAIMESYPEQCAMNGKTFINDKQSLNDDVSEYVGLTEQAALDKAVSTGKAARVVERDGESLPVDASFQPGRLNFHVRDDKVITVVVEAE